MLKPKYLGHLLHVLPIYVNLNLSICLSVSMFFTNYKLQVYKIEIWSHLLKKSFIENFIFCALKTAIAMAK